MSRSSVFQACAEAAGLWRTPIRYAHHNDADLIELIAQAKQADEKEAKAAFTELYKRHVAWMYDTAQRSHRSYAAGNRDVFTEHCVQDTMMKAYQHAHTFRRKEYSSDKECQKHVRAWLGGILRRVMIDGGRSRSVIAQVSLDTDKLSELLSAPGDVSEEQSELVQKMVEVFEQLSPREQDILLTTAEYYQPGAKHQRLPNEDSRMLAERWHTTPENIRKLRSRAMAKLKNQLTHLVQAKEGADHGEE